MANNFSKPRHLSKTSFRFVFDLYPSQFLNDLDPSYTEDARAALTGDSETGEGSGKVDLIDF